MPDEPFRLRPPPPPKKRFEDQPDARQAVLFSGLGCLPGQGNLFQTDGPKEKPDAEEATRAS